jgi:hypothetical protein
VPANPGELAGHYDLTISFPGVEMASFASFSRWLAQAAGEHGLTCALIHDGVVEEAIRRLGCGQLAIGFHLDYFALWHVPDDPYARLAVAIQDAGGHPVNAPARARAFTDKAAAHAELLRHGLGVPPAVVLRPWDSVRALTASERQRLGLEGSGGCVYIKPANGYGGRGVVCVDGTDPDRFAAALTDARRFDPRDAYLVQREVRCPVLACEDGWNRPAYWRVLCCLGERTVFWWSPQDKVNPGAPSYRLVTAGEMQRHRLQPLLDYARALEERTGLEWFSTELCLSEGAEPSRYTVTGADGRDRPVVAVDYVNDQCAVDVQSRWAGALPDEVVRHLAERFAEAAWRVRQQKLRPESVAFWRAVA